MNINFLFPNFLWMSLLALVPLVIHLINLRKHKVVYFSDISLLKSVQSTSNSTKKVKNWLILLLRMLMIVLISIVFAQPYIPNSNQKFIEGKSIAIFMDTSPSMLRYSESSNCITVAKNGAEQIVQSYPEGTLFKIFTTDNLNQAQFPNNSNRAKDLIAQSKIGNYSTDFNKLYKRIVNDEDIQALHIVSDFLDELDTNQFQFSPFSVLYYPVLNTQSPQLIIDSVYFESPIRKFFGEEELKISALVQGVKDSVKTKFTVKVNDMNYFTSNNLTNKSIQNSVVFPVVSSKIIKGTVEAEFTAGTSNKFLWSYVKKENVKVLLISNDNEIIQVLQKIYQTEELIDFEVVSEQKNDFSKLNEYDLIILGGLNQFYASYANDLYNFLQQGNVLCVIPGSKINLDNYNQFYQNLNLSYKWNESVKDTLNANKMDLKHHFFKDIFKNLSMDFNSIIFPKVFQSYPVQVQSSSNINLISLNNQNPWLSLQNNCFTFSSNISAASTNLKQHPLVVALFLKIALSSSQNQNLYYSIFQNTFTNFTTKSFPQLKVKTPNSTFFNWKANNLGVYTVDNQFDETGFYDILLNDSLIDVLSVNIPPTEYLIKNNSFVQSLSNLNNVIEINSSGNLDLSMIQEGKKISIYFIWLLILILIIESLVLFKIVKL